jgi:copper chaperone CopZ
MTCGNCVKQVTGLLLQDKSIEDVQIDLPKSEASIKMAGHVSTETLKGLLKEFPKYQLSELRVDMPVKRFKEEKRSWLSVYKPILLIFGYILAVTLITEYVAGEFLWMRWMNHFMAGFFLVFSFFKLLNLRGFAETYSMYDIVAKKWNGWGYVYAFTELFLGLAFLTGFNPLVTNIITFAVMTVSIIGVLQSVLNKTKIKCACLGDVFNLPMSTVTIIEDALMILMSAVMIIKLII